MTPFYEPGITWWLHGHNYVLEPGSDKTFGQVYQIPYLEWQGLEWPSELGIISWGQFVQSQQIAECRMYLMILAWIACMWLGFKIYDWLAMGDPLRVEGSRDG